MQKTKEKTEKTKMTENDWIEISSRVKAVFNLGIQKAEWLSNCKMAKFIAAIPFLAGCEKAKTTSFTHLSVYYMSTEESGKDIFLHKEEDDADLFNRLKPISNFIGGDKKILDCCMSLIALNMICNYRKDDSYDNMIGKYNPVTEGVWDFAALYERLVDNITKNITSDIAEYYTIKAAEPGVWLD